MLDLSLIRVVAAPEAFPRLYLAKDILPHLYIGIMRGVYVISSVQLTHDIEPLYRSYDRPFRKPLTSIAPGLYIYGRRGIR